MFKFNMAVIAILILFAAAGLSAAQSTDRDRPTPLKSDELRANFSQDDPEYFYSFIAGPGVVIFTLDVKGAQPGGGIPYFHLFSGNGSEIDSFDKFAAGDSSEKLVKRVSFAKRQRVTMRRGKPIGKGSYRLQISGAVALDEAANGGGDWAGDRMGLPTAGTLRIEMTDGSAQEFDLRRVRQVAIKP